MSDQQDARVRPAYAPTENEVSVFAQINNEKCVLSKELDG